MVLQSDPVHPDALHLLGLIAYQAGKTEQAVGFIRQAISANKRVSDYYKTLVTVLIAVDRLGEAEACLREMLVIIPSSNAHNNLGSVLQKQGRISEAIECYRRAAKLDPDNSTIWNNLGSALHAAEELDESARCYRRALTIAPEYCDAILNLGNVLIAKGLNDEGIQTYRRLILMSVQIEINNPRPAGQAAQSLSIL